MTFIFGLGRGMASFRFAYCRCCHKDDHINPASRSRFVAIIEDIYLRCAQGAILGCTEIGMLVKQADTSIPLFGTTVIHAQAPRGLRWRMGRFESSSRM